MHSDRDNQRRFHVLLSNVSDAIEERTDAPQRKKIWFLVQPVVGKMRTEKCKSLLEVFEQLVHQDLIAYNRIENLEKLMSDAFSYHEGLTQALRQLFQEYKRTNMPQPVRTPTNTISHNTDDSIFASLIGANNADQVRHTPIQKDPPAVFIEAFEFAASQIGYDWKVFAKLTQISHSDILSTEKRFNYDVRDQATNIFQIWYSQQTSPSMRGFRQALRDIPRNDIADELKRRQKQK